MPGWWLWLASARAQDVSGVVCPPGDPDPTCTHASLAAALGDVGLGGWGAFEVRSGTYVTDALAVVGRRLDLSTTGAVTVVGPGGQTPFEVLLGELNLTGLAVTALNARAIDAGPGATVSVEDGVLFTIGVSAEGGAVRIERGAFEARGTLFLDNLATGSGGHLLAIDSTVTLTDCTFQGGFARDGGAAFFRSDDDVPDDVTLIEGRWVDNLATGTGGALALQGPIRLQVLDSRFEDNLAGIGAAIGELASGAGASTIAVAGGSFERNEAEVAGGALALATADATLTDTLLIGNGADLGGAVWVDRGALDLTRALLCGNQALQGGAVWSATPAVQTFSASRFVENASAGAGGVVYHAGGELALTHGSFLGNAAVVGGVVLTSGRVVLTDSLVAHTAGASAFDAPGLGVVEERHNAFYANVAGDLPPGQSRDPSDVTADPQLRRYEPGAGCEAFDDHSSWYGPLRDAGDPAGPSDLDGTRADIGAHGGPDAALGSWSDPDGDGVPLVYDCVEGDPRFYPDLDPDDGPTHDLPYDGLDFDCDGFDDFDADRDGFPLDQDCDDADPDRYPGAPEVAGGGVDHNCDGRLDADLDGWEWPVDCDDADPTINPAQVEDADPTVDRDCVPPADLTRPLQPATSCAVGPGGAGWTLALLGAALVRRRR